MIEGVIDASVLLAVLKDEAIDEAAYFVVSRGVVSTVNVAELYSKAATLSPSSIEGIEDLLNSLLAVHVFTPEQAKIAGSLRIATQHAGLSLGDRACLALALDLKLPVYTGDRNWMRVDVGCRIHCLR